MARGKVRTGVAVGEVPTKCRESGAIFFLLAAGLAVVLIGFLSLALNIAETRSTKSRLQEIVDSAAQKGAATLCSTAACFADAREIALRTIEDELIRSKLAASGLQLSRSGGPQWTTAGGIVVSVERGYWWPDDVSNLAIPTSSVVLHSNNRFEPIDRPVGSTPWQSENKMRPQHVVANALFVQISRDHALDALAVYGVHGITQDAAVYGIAGDVEGGTACAAPFAVHVCSVINQNGDFDETVASRYERFFTGINRYCAANDPHCDVIPGSLWSPVVDENRRNRRNAPSNDMFTPGPWTPAGASPYIYRHSCSYEPVHSTRVTQDSLADQFGVVGLPGNAGTATQTAVLQTLLAVPDTTVDLYTPGGCTATKIGDRFDILSDGLDGTIDTGVLGVSGSTSADDIVWAQINDSSESSDHHLDYNQTFLNYGVPTGKAQADTGWFYNPLSPDTRSTLCDEYPSPRVGACNSRLMEVSRPCVENVYGGMLSWGCSNLNFASGILDSEFVHACPPQYTDSDGNVQNDPSYYQRSNNGFVLDSRYDYQSYFNANLDGPNPSIPRVSPKVWRIPISVLAPAGDSSDTATYADYCQGLGTNSTLDPPFDPALDYYVIGFVEALIYDTDVGQDSFDPVELSGICPTSVFDFYTEFQPWGFNGGEGGVANRCNMVKGVINRGNNLITGKTAGGAAVALNSVTLVVP